MSGTGLTPYNLRMAKADFEATFATLRKVLKPYAESYPPIVDQPGKYYLACKMSKTTSGFPIWFKGFAGFVKKFP